MKPLARGLTLIEVLVVIVIIGLVLAITLISFRNFRDRQALLGAGEEVLALLAEARAQTLATTGDPNYQFGLHFEADRAVMFLGPSYSAGAPGNVAVELAPRVTISDVALGGGGAELLFARLTGAPSAAGTVTLSLVVDPAKQLVIVIENSGLAYLQ